MAGFVVFALLALLVGPFLVRLHTRTLRDCQAKLIQPADEVVNELQLSLAVGMSLLRGYELSNEDVFIETYRDVLAREQRAFEELKSYATRMSPETYVKYREFRDNVHLLRARTEQKSGQDEHILDLDLELIPRQQVTYEKALAAAVELKHALRGEVEQNQHAIDATESAGASLNVLLVLVALAASAVVYFITRELRELAATAARDRVRVERMGHTKARMIRGISHDLRNPLAVAHMAAGFLEADASSVVTDRQRQALARLQRSLQSMAQIMDDLLDVAASQGGEIAIRFSPIDLSDVLRTTVEDHRMLAEQKGLELDLVDATLPRFDTDPTRVREILNNLLSNALKYTPSGGRVEMRAVFRSKDGLPRPKGWCVVEVKDSGPGIPEEAQQRIFREYIRLDTRQRGLGIGLSISRRIAKKLGGRLTVESAPNRGSVFALWLPLALAPAHSAD